MHDVVGRANQYKEKSGLWSCTTSRLGRSVEAIFLLLFRSLEALDLTGDGVHMMFSY